MRSRLELLFPGLRSSEYSITSPATHKYNCVAWALGIVDRWMWPLDGYHWIDDVPRGESIAGFVTAFQVLRFELCDSSDLERGFEKIAIYADDASNPTHVARQLPSGRWTSKLGRYEDIEHDLSALVDSDYGRITVLMKRVRPKGA